MQKSGLQHLSSTLEETSRNNFTINYNMKKSNTNKICVCIYGNSLPFATSFCEISLIDYFATVLLLRQIRWQGMRFKWNIVKFFKVILWRDTYASLIGAVPSPTPPARKSKKILRELIDLSDNVNDNFSLVLKGKLNKESEWHFLN